MPLGRALEFPRLAAESSDSQGSDCRPRSGSATQDERHGLGSPWSRHMKTLDLRSAVPDALDSLVQAAAPASVSSVLERLGVSLAPTLDRPTAEQEPGSLLSLGRLQLLGELGRGGMGRVLEARDLELRRRVAVKLLIDPVMVS